MKCTPRAVALAMRSPSLRLEQAIADEIDVTIEALFPERYDADGSRLPQTRAKSSTRRTSDNVKATEAA